MAITQTQLETEIEQIKTLIDAGSYSQAKVTLTKARLTMAAMPDYMIGGRSMHYRDTLDDIEVAIDKLESNSSDGKKNRRVFARYYRG